MRHGRRHPGAAQLTQCAMPAAALAGAGQRLCCAAGVAPRVPQLRGGARQVRAPPPLTPQGAASPLMRSPRAPYLRRRRALTARFPASPPRSAITRGADGLIVPHGGKLVDLMVTEPKQRAALFAECQGRKIELSDRNACDVELLTVGCARAPALHRAWRCGCACAWAECAAPEQRLFAAQRLHERGGVRALRRQHAAEGAPLRCALRLCRPRQR